MWGRYLGDGLRVSVESTVQREIIMSTIHIPWILILRCWVLNLLRITTITKHRALGSRLPHRQHWVYLTRVPLFQVVVGNDLTERWSEVIGSYSWSFTSKTKLFYRHFQTACIETLESLYVYASKTTSVNRCNSKNVSEMRNNRRYYVHLQLECIWTKSIRIQASIQDCFSYLLIHCRLKSVICVRYHPQCFARAATAHNIVT